MGRRESRSDSGGRSTLVQRMKTWFGYYGYIDWRAKMDWLP